MLYKQAFACISMSEELKTVFQAVVRVNYVKKSPLTGRLFAKLCDDMETEHMAPLYYCEICWLSRATVLQSVLVLEDEIGNFMHDDVFYIVDFIQKLNHLVDIFEN
jgi:hypothetical protein